MNLWTRKLLNFKTVALHNFKISNTNKSRTMTYTDNQVLTAQKSTNQCHTEWQKGRKKQKSGMFL